MKGQVETSAWVHLKQMPAFLRRMNSSWFCFLRSGSSFVPKYWGGPRKPRPSTAARRSRKTRHSATAAGAGGASAWVGEGAEGGAEVVMPAEGGLGAAPSVIRTRAGRSRGAAGREMVMRLSAASVNSTRMANRASRSSDGETRSEARDGPRAPPAKADSSSWRKARSEH